MQHRITTVTVAVHLTDAVSETIRTRELIASCPTGRPLVSILCPALEATSAYLRWYASLDDGASWYPSQTDASAVRRSPATAATITHVSADLLLRHELLRFEIVDVANAVVPQTVERTFYLDSIGI